MAEEWFCSIAGKVSGPLSAQQLREMTSKGYLSPNDLVRCGAVGAWFPAGRVKGLFAAPGTAPSDSAGVAAGSASSASVPVAKPLPAPPQGPPPGVRAPETRAPLPRPGSPAAPPLDLAFLDQEPAAPPRAAARTGTPLPQRSDRERNRRSQKLLVWVLVGVLAGLTAVAIAVQVWVSRIEPPLAKSEEVARKEEPAKPKVKDPEAVVGLSDQALERLQLPGAAGVKALGKDSTKGGKEAAELDASPWVDAASPAAIGDIEVKIRSVALGRPAWLRVSGRGAKAQYLVLTLELANASKDRKVDHAGWRPGAAVRLTDDRQPPNTYALKLGYAGREGPEAIYPGESIEDRLVFDKPVDTAKRLRLQLPAAAFGGQGMVKFEIPREMVTAGERAEAPETPAPAAAAQASGTQPPAAAAAAPSKADAMDEGPSGDPRHDFGIQEEDGKALGSAAVAPEPQEAKTTQGGAGRKPAKAGGKRKASGSAQDAGQDSGFEKATRQKAPF